MSPNDVEMSIGLSHTTIRRWYRRFIQAILEEISALLLGTVEVDEAFVGRRRSGS